MKTNNKKTSKRKIAVIAIVAVIAMGLLWVAPFFLSGASADTTVHLRKGSTLAAVQDSVAKPLGDAFASRMVTLLRLSGSDVSRRQGAFDVKKGDSPFAVARHLRSGAANGVKFTFNNLRTKRELADRIASRFMMGDSIYAALNDTAVCAKFGKTPDNIVTIFIPDSYEFYWDITVDQLLSRMNEYYTKFWTDSRKAKAAKLGITPDDAQIVASIVEEGTAKSDERGKVARLYLNRLKSGMPLQADPTVKFALGDFSIKRITVPMTKVNSPYNTYRSAGLPPGPIRLPEKATIDAVLNAPAHNYTYMCAKEDFSGYHNFTTNYADHLANAAKYQKALDSRGIK